MSSALDEFRAQREAVEDLHRRLTEVAALVRMTRAAVEEFLQNEGLQALVRDEKVWLVRADQLVNEVRRFRRSEVTRFWPAVWRRWGMAIALVALSAFVTAAGYAWTNRLTNADIAELRSRVEVAARIERRVMEMTPGERRQFERLMSPTAGEARPSR